MVTAITSRRLRQSSHPERTVLAYVPGLCVCSSSVKRGVLHSVKFTLQRQYIAATTAAATVATFRCVAAQHLFDLNFIQIYGFRVGPVSEQLHYHVSNAPTTAHLLLARARGARATQRS